MSQRKIELQLLQRSEAMAEAAQLGKSGSANLLSSAARGVSIKPPGEEQPTA